MVRTGPPDAGCTVWRVYLDERGGDARILASDEIERLGRMRSDAKQREFLVSRTALRVLLGRQLGVEPAAIEFKLGEHGKPRLAAGGLNFNVSHSGDLAVIALSPAGDLGVDVEQETSGRPFRRLAQRFFAPAERASLERLPAAARRRHFYRLWTLKEAYLKALGTGLTVSSRHFTVVADDESATLLSPAPGYGRADDWVFHRFEASPGYVGAVCAPPGVGSPRVRDYAAS